MEKKENNNISEKSLAEALKEIRLSMDDEEYFLWLASQSDPKPGLPFFTDEEALQFIEDDMKCTRGPGYLGPDFTDLDWKTTKQIHEKQFTVEQKAWWLYTHYKTEQRFHKPTIHTKAHEALPKEEKIVDDLIRIGLLCLERQFIDKLSILYFKFIPGEGIGYQFSTVRLDGTEVNLDYQRDIDHSDREKEAIYEVEDFLPQADKKKVTDLLKAKSEKKFSNIRKKTKNK